MDPFKLGLRNVLGIMLPGAVIVLAACYVLLSLPLVFGQIVGSSVPVSTNTPWNVGTITNRIAAADRRDSPDSKPIPNAAFGEDNQILRFIDKQQGFVWATLFLTSYLLGSIVRLNSADNLDRKSGQRCLKDIQQRWTYESPNCSPVELLRRLTEAYEAFLDGKKEVSLPAEFDRWVWAHEAFPYPVWQFRKFQRYHPPETLRFYKAYAACMGIGVDRDTAPRRKKEFFNYCKMVICHANSGEDNSLLAEIHFAEAQVRFYAGTYYGLLYSFYILCVLLGVQFGALVSRVASMSPLNVVHITMTTLLTIAAWQMQKTLVHRFRTLRLKEVDTVYDAFYLTHRHADHCPECSAAKEGIIAPSHLASNPSEEDRFRERTDLLREASVQSIRSKGTSGAIALDVLLSLMKQRSPAQHYLSSIYFAGSQEDHPFFLQSKSIAAGLAVLPEDAAKSSVCKKHPHQQEVIFVLVGTIRLEREENGRRVMDDLIQGQVKIIGQGQCHRILPVDDKIAAYLFIKTDPAKPPQAENCSLP